MHHAALVGGAASSPRHMGRHRSRGPSMHPSRPPVYGHPRSRPVRVHVSWRPQPCRPACFFSAHPPGKQPVFIQPACTRRAARTSCQNQLPEPEPEPAACSACNLAETESREHAPRWQPGRPEPLLVLRAPPGPTALSRAGRSGPAPAPAPACRCLDCSPRPLCLQPVAVLLDRHKYSLVPRASRSRHSAPLPRRGRAQSPAGQRAVHACTCSQLGSACRRLPAAARCQPPWTPAVHEPHPPPAARRRALPATAPRLEVRCFVKSTGTSSSPSPQPSPPPPSPAITITTTLHHPRPPPRSPSALDAAALAAASAVVSPTPVSPTPPPSPLPPRPPSTSLPSDARSARPDCQRGPSQESLAFGALPRPAAERPNCPRTTCAAVLATPVIDDARRPTPDARRSTLDARRPTHGTP